MNSAKFASITPDLVVRKGEARPWPQQSEPAVRSPRAVAAGEDEDPLEADGYHPPAQDGTRRCSLRLTSCEYERLGIIAVKRNTSRQQILRAAVEEYLSAIELEYGRECGCLGGRSCRNVSKSTAELPETSPNRHTSTQSGEFSFTSPLRGGRSGVT